MIQESERQEAIRRAREDEFRLIKERKTEKKKAKTLEKLNKKLQAGMEQDTYDAILMICPQPPITDRLLAAILDGDIPNVTYNI